MPANILYDLGTVTLTDDLIATIAGTAAVENYGIVAMNSKSATDAILQLVGSDNMKRGVKVTILNDGTTIDIDLHVTVMYGVSLPVVAQNAVSNVKYRVEDLTGLHVRNVNIFVESIKV
ncbi:MAG: Asp23/Gls24 family envelope stress response protein [Clostridiales bacterium]|nr:Asp23/Gls24 family envelope stress response protein [Clostridiales bacterium]